MWESGSQAHPAPEVARRDLTTIRNTIGYVYGMIKGREADRTGGPGGRSGIQASPGLADRIRPRTGLEQSQPLVRFGRDGP